MKKSNLKFLKVLKHFYIFWQINFFMNSFCIFFFLKFLSHLWKSQKINQLNITKVTKKDYKRVLQKISVFLKKQKKKGNNMDANDIKISLKMKNKSKFSVEKDTMKCGK